MNNANLLCIATIAQLTNFYCLKKPIDQWLQRNAKIGFTVYRPNLSPPRQDIAIKKADLLRKTQHHYQGLYHYSLAYQDIGIIGRLLKVSYFWVRQGSRDWKKKFDRDSILRGNMSHGSNILRTRIKHMRSLHCVMQDRNVPSHIAATTAERIELNRRISPATGPTPQSDWCFWSELKRKLLPTKFEVTWSSSLSKKLVRSMPKCMRKVVQNHWGILVSNLPWIHWYYNY